MNAVLGAAFEDVVAGRGRRKARVLTARGPRPGVTARPPEEADRDVPGVGRLHLVAHAGTFGGAAADPGSRLLLASLALGSVGYLYTRGRMRRAAVVAADTS